MPLQTRLTKTFVQNTWYRRTPGDQPQSWQRVPDADDVHLDQQIRDWVTATGNLIIHPGQLGMHSQFHDAELTLKCITLGLTVLYIAGAANGQQEQARPTGIDADPTGADGGAGTVGPTADVGQSGAACRN